MYADKRNNARISDIIVGDKVLVKLKRKRKSDPYYNSNPYTNCETKSITSPESFFKMVPQFDDHMYDDIQDDNSAPYDSENNGDNGVLRTEENQLGSPPPPPPLTPPITIGGIAEYYRRERCNVLQLSIHNTNIITYNY